MCQRLLGRPSFNARFDEIFDRGIDPDVDDPTQCHAHPEVPDAWPRPGAVLAYRDRVRAEVLASETLLYMIRQLPLSRLVRPAPPPIYALGDALRARPIEIDPGYATLGVDFHDLDFGWDNEFPRTTVAVPRFVIDSTPVTNGEFLELSRAAAMDVLSCGTTTTGAGKKLPGSRIRSRGRCGTASGSTARASASCR